MPKVEMEMYWGSYYQTNMKFEFTWDLVMDSE